jgi:high-affinity iron transporter
MTSSIIISFRESLEAVLITGIILATLTRQQKQALKPYVIIGALLGVVVSVLGGALLFTSAQGLPEETMELIEGVMMLVASGLIAYFVVWLSTQTSSISKSISDTVSKKSTGFGLALLAFLGVFREGLELVVFTMAKLSTQANELAIGTGIGITAAILLGVLVFKTSIKLNLTWIFKALGLILILIGADLLAKGLVKLNFRLNGFETVIMVLYAVVALVFFFKSDLLKLIAKQA